MNLIERIVKIIDEDLPRGFIRKQIKNNPEGWVELGQGWTGAVYQHAQDPDIVVKVTGAGAYNEPNQAHNRGTLAFIDFLVHNGYKSKHFPIAHGINLDDPEVIQIRMERLVEIPPKVGKSLEDLAIEVEYGTKWQQYLLSSDFQNLTNNLRRYNLFEKNRIDDIWNAVILANKALPTLEKKYKVDMDSDLHEGNWMVRPDKTIVINDPWVGLE